MLNFGSLASTVSGALSGSGAASGLGASSSADGDNTFSNAFNFKTGAGQTNNTQVVVIGVAVIAGLYFLTRGK